MQVFHCFTFGGVTARPEVAMRQAHALHEQITVVIDSREQAPYRFRRMALADLLSLGVFRRFLTW